MRDFAEITWFSGTIEGISRRKKTINGEYIILTAYELPMSWDHMSEMESMVTTHSNI